METPIVLATEALKPLRSEGGGAASEAEDDSERTERGGELRGEGTALVRSSVGLGKRMLVLVKALGFFLVFLSVRNLSAYRSWACFFGSRHYHLAYCYHGGFFDS